MNSIVVIWLFHNLGKQEYFMEEKITHKDWLKHYLASVLIYGVIFIFLIFCPAYYETIQNDKFDYTVFFAIYYILYVILAPIIFAIVKPKSVLNSRSLTILRYIKRQFKSGRTTETFLQDIAPNSSEKLAFMTLFIQTFFGVYCVNKLCNTYLPDLGYNFDFIGVMFGQAVQYVSLGNGIKGGIIQFIVDTSDVWLKLIMTFTLVVLAFSYLTELNIFKNKIKSADTTFLGVLSCIACYYPITILTDKFIKITDQSLLPVNNTNLLVVLNIFAIIANLGILIAVLRLGTKSGNLTNRGIVTGFPYNIVRHPDYAMQILYIIVTTIPLYLMPSDMFLGKFTMTVATLAWIYLYYLRAITEERHLIQDEDYKAYVEKVKYRFIPKLF